MSLLLEPPTSTSLHSRSLSTSTTEEIPAPAGAESHHGARAILLSATCLQPKRRLLGAAMIMHPTGNITEPSSQDITPTQSVFAQNRLLRRRPVVATMSTGNSHPICPPPAGVRMATWQILISHQMIMTIITTSWVESTRMRAQRIQRLAKRNPQHLKQQSNGSLILPHENSNE